MTSFSEFINNLENYIGIIILMLSTFLIGYFAAWWSQKSKFGKLTKKLQEQVQAMKTKQKINDIDTIFTEIKPKIVEVVKETREEIQEEFHDDEPEEANDPESIAEKARTSFITYTKAKPELDFDSFGYGDLDQKDDLTEINGIGPYIEQRLNEIGICNYDQISKLTPADIRTVTELIDFFPGRIERDNWVAQAAALKIY